MIPFDLHYQWPSAAYLILLVLPALLCFWALFVYRQKISFVKDMILKRSSAVFWIKSAIFLCAIIFCVIALMQPVGNGHYPEGVVPKKAPLHVEDLPFQLKRKGHDVIFLIDASASMQVPDTRLQKSRLDYAKIIADEIIATLSGETISLYAFTSDISQLAPLTLDYLFTRLMIKEIQVNEGGIPGTDIANLLQKMRINFFPEDATPAESSRLKTFILLSDGEDTALEFFPEAMKTKGLHDLAKYLESAAQNHVRFYTIGMGSVSGGVIPNITDQGNPVISNLNADLLKLLANTGRGSYYESNLYTPAQLVKDLLSDMAKDPPYYEEKLEAVNSALLQALFGENTLLYDRYFQIPLALAIICLVFTLLFPNSLKESIRSVLRIGPLLLLFCFVENEVKGDEDFHVAEINRAKAYAEAKMYDQARTLYEGLLRLPISDQQKAALQYNIGTLYLEEGSWDLAIRQLSETVAKKNLQPFLYRKLYTNLTLAQYEKALSFDNDPSETLKQLGDALKTSKNLPEKEQAKLRMVIKGKMLLLQEEVSDKDVKKSEINRIQRLYNGISHALEALKYLEEQKMTSQLVTDYVALFAEQQKQWIPLWEKNNETSPSFDEALKAYRELTKATDNKEFRKAINFGKVSQNFLSLLMEQLAKGSLLQEKLRRLLNGYQQLLVRKSWRNKLWETLQQLYEAIEHEEGIKEINFEINRSRQDLSQAIEAFQNGKFFFAQMFAKDAAQWIKIASAKTAPMTSKNLLVTMIQQQEYLIRLAELLLEKKADNELTKLLQPLLSEGQKIFKPFGDLYFSTLYQEQVEAFSNQGLCQSTPWGEVLPLLDAGNQAAAYAEAILVDASESLDQRVMQVWLLQQSAVNQWQKALVEINHPTAQSSSCLGGGSGGTSPVSASNESLTNLLQMETQDKKPLAPSANQQTVLHPW
ncbi:MAG: VWA domain-containing protein [Parachlamydiaceae bacterium]|nr:VWA domain-containing protein [Parachlamydiaceae bacterium]